MARELTEQQFSDGTTIDGERLDAAMQDATERFNAIRPRNIRRRFLPTRYVMGWMPNLGTNISLPWLSQRNVSGEIVSGGGSENNVTNRLRTKGVLVPGDYPLSTWSTALYFRRPVVLHRLTFQMQTEHPDPSLGYLVGGRDNSFLYATDAPEGYNTGDDAEDVSVNVSVDSIFDPENRSQADKEIACHRFKVRKEAYTQVGPVGGLPAPTVDGFPNSYPLGPMHGHCMDLVDLNIPLHERSRVRIDVTLPRYPSGDNVHSGWNEDNFWYKQCFDLALVVLEEVE